LRWNDTAAATSRGAVLFAEWWLLYTEAIEARDMRGIERGFPNTIQVPSGMR
jgi:hypothetical protein